MTAAQDALGRITAFMIGSNGVRDAQLRADLRTVAEALEAAKPLDPKPWRYDLLGGPVDERAREAQQETGGFSFAPREEFRQDREAYR